MMQTNWDKAKIMLADGDYTCVLCGGETVYTSKERGVKPLLGWLEQEISCDGFCAADKVVGKATALLYVLLRVRAVYAPVMSQEAHRVLEMHRVEVACDQLVPAIQNRTRTGFCPMEQAVQDIEDPILAKQAIQKRLEELIQNG